MLGWLDIRQRGLAILPWWEIVVKPGIRRLSINRTKEIQKQKRCRLNCLIMKQNFFKESYKVENMSVERGPS